MSKSELTEQQLRRKRINTYKRIIVIIILTLIILPTVLCVVLFCRVNSLNREIKEMKASGIYYQADSQQETDEEETTPYVEDEEETTPPDNKTNTNVVVETTAPEDEKSLVAQALDEGRKVVYLTFDDGPGANTSNLLDVLDKYNVKATFFVNGFTGYEEQLNRMLDEGFSLGMHTYTHDYSVVYGSMEGFKSEVTQIQDYLEDATGVKPFLFRFPGGSSNTVTQIPIASCITYLKQQNITYFDWNVSSGDGDDGLTSDKVYNNVMKGIKSNDVSVVLMHDSTARMTTYEAVPRIIESLQAMDALILPITSDTVPVHHNVK